MCFMDLFVCAVCLQCQLAFDLSARKCSRKSCRSSCLGNVRTLMASTCGAKPNHIGLIDSLTQRCDYFCMAMSHQLAEALTNFAQTACFG